VRQAGALDVDVERRHVDELRAVAVGRGGDRAGQRLLARLGPHRHHLPGLDVGGEAHGEVGEPLKLLGTHGQERM
jgi:hypothetical protein